MDPVKLLIYAQVAIGIGLVIFVHELGHFLAARLCGVRVEVFSLGFGPKLFSWKRNGTVYQLALLPLGGFVRMAGEDRFSGEPHGPDDLPSKGVGARFLIYSGGVIMNVVFGLVVFPLVLFHGVPFLEPVVGQAQPGGPAWHAGIEPGTRILEINGNPIVSFEYIANEVALGPPESTRLLIQAPGESAPREVTLRPEYDRVAGLNRVQVVPSFDLSLGFAVQPGSPAAEAGLRDGDRLVGVRDGLPGLTLVEQLDGAFQDAGPVGFSVERPADDGTSERIDFELAPHVVELKGTPALGVSPRFGLLEGTRANADLEAFGLQAGDRMLEVDGRAIQRPLDLERALVAGGEQARAVQMIVARGGRELTLNSAAELERTRRVRLSRDMALTYDLDGEVVMVAPGGAAALAGLLDGDRILRLDGAPVENWEEVRTRIRAHRSDLPLRIEVERVSAEGQASVVDLSASLAAPTSIEYGVGFHLATYVYQASGFGDAVRVGVASSWKFVVDTYLTLKRILFGQVSSENIGGIITIAAVSASWAEEGLAKLLFILCMLSMNLAFINVLPIPVLDGGHLFFLAVEKIKGSPVSERVLGYSQVVGVVLILSLMIYVTYNDLMRWVFTG